jgi:GT2 family glycosyltransferase
MRLAILISIYKAGEFIEAKILNILRQAAFKDLDVILLNCQNLDNERGVYKKYLSLPNIREIVIDDYCTLYHAWNEGIKSTDANYIVNSNVDDMLRPGATAMMMKYLLEYDVVFSPYAISNTPNRHNWDGKSPKNLVQRCAWDRLFLGPCPAVRKDVFKKTGLYDPDLFVCGDADMWGRWDKVGATNICLDVPLVLYYHNKHSLERRTDEKGKSLLYKDGQTRKGKDAADWTPEMRIYPEL